MSNEANPSPPGGAPVRGGSRFEALLQQLRDGDDSAAATFLDEFGPGLIKAVRRRMNPRLRERYDSQDFTQAVWASFFGNIDQVSRFTGSADLIRFLAAMARNKVIDAGRQAQVRQALHADSVAPVDVNRDLRLGISEPTPSQHAVAQEQWDRLAREENQQAVRILRLRAGGMTQQEIAETLNISDRHVRRILTRLQRKSES